MSMESFVGDLHIHSALSPCAEREMDPPRIFQRALELGLNMLAITDHNTVKNLPAFLRDVPPDLWVIPGVELQTREEIHLLILFDGLDTAMDFGQEMAGYLPEQPNIPAIFGEQILLDRQGIAVGAHHSMLLTSVNLNLTDVLQRIKSYETLCYPAHVDRKAYSILSQLGFLPSELPLPTVEISYRINADEAERLFPGVQWVQSSDAHQISELGRGCSLFQLEEKSWEELKAAFFCREGRSIRV